MAAVVRFDEENLAVMIGDQCRCDGVERSELCVPLFWFDSRHFLTVPVRLCDEVKEHVNDRLTSP